LTEAGSNCRRSVTCRPGSSHLDRAICVRGGSVQREHLANDARTSEARALLRGMRHSVDVFPHLRNARASSQARSTVYACCNSTNLRWNGRRKFINAFVELGSFGGSCQRCGGRRSAGNYILHVIEVASADEALMFHRFILPGLLL